MSASGKETIERCPFPGCGGDCYYHPPNPRHAVYISNQVACTLCDYRGPLEDPAHPGAKHNTFSKEVEALRALADNFELYDEIMEQTGFEGGRNMDAMYRQLTIIKRLRAEAGEGEG